LRSHSDCNTRSPNANVARTEDHKWLASSHSYKREAYALLADRANTVGEIEKNLGALTDMETGQLLWILQNCGKRFDQRVEYSLVEKKIVVPVNRSGSLYDVDDHVLSFRDDILAKAKDGKIPKEFPVRSWMGG
jgi:hypothetical protein